jgi:hypothetical protein
MDDISKDIELSRVLGYQEIHSKRGARASRAGGRKRSITTPTKE